MPASEREQALDKVLAEGRELERRIRELTLLNKDLEERAAVFQREAEAGGKLISNLEQTLRVSDEARVKLSAALDRQGEELSRWRKEAVARETEILRLKNEMTGVMASAESVRREGVEAFEQARELQRRDAKS